MQAWRDQGDGSSTCHLNVTNYVVTFSHMAIPTMAMRQPMRAISIPRIESSPDLAFSANRSPQDKQRWASPAFFAPHIGQLCAKSPAIARSYRDWRQEGSRRETEEQTIRFHCGNRPA